MVQRAHSEYRKSDHRLDRGFERTWSPSASAWRRTRKGCDASETTVQRRESASKRAWRQWTSTRTKWPIGSRPSPRKRSSGRRETCDGPRTPSGCPARERRKKVPMPKNGRDYANNPSNRTASSFCCCWPSPPLAHSAGRSSRLRPQTWRRRNRSSLRHHRRQRLKLPRPHGVHPPGGRPRRVSSVFSGPQKSA
jgi:hypothetical protein